MPYLPERPRWYIRDADGTIHLATTFVELERSRSLDINHCRLAYTDINEQISVSTVFLNLDHSYSFADRMPILFETFVFGGPMDGEMDRYATEAEALEGHDKIVQEVKEQLGREGA